MSRTLPRRPEGFSLLEVMAVLAICTVLAAVAIPIYTRYQNHTRRAERPALLDAMARSVMEYVEHNGRLPTPTGSGADSSIACDWNPALPLSGKRKRFDEHAPCWELLTVKQDGLVYHHFQITGSMTSGAGDFTLHALSDLDADGLPSEWLVKYAVVNGSWQKVSEGLSPGSDDF